MSLEPVSAANAAAALGAAAVTVTAGPIDATPILGIPVDVLLAASAGALLGLAYTKPETWQRFMGLPQGTLAMRIGWTAARTAGLLFVLGCNALLAGWSVAIIPSLPGFAWSGQIAPQPFAGVLAFVSQFAVPRLIKAVEEWRAPWSKVP